MRQRALLHVAGPDGAGKTAFSETLLRHLAGSVLCVRGIRDETLAEPEISAPQEHPELARYREAGAGSAVLYRFPGAQRKVHDDFFMADFMQDYANAVLVEGDSPIERADLSVFVAPPSPPGGALLRRELREHTMARAASIDLWENVIASPEALAQGMANLLGNSAFGDVALRHRDILEDTRTAATAALERWRAEPPPEPTEHWTLAPGYEGIEHAQLVVVNVPAPAIQDAGMLLQDLLRLRKDEAVFEDVMGPRGSKKPITAVAGDVTNPHDPGLRKALARVRRALGRGTERQKRSTARD